MFGIGPPELIVIMVVALIVFGPERLPQIASQIGKAVRDFRQMSSDLTGEFNRTIQAADFTATAPTPQLNATHEAQESPSEVTAAVAESPESTADDAALRSAEEHSATGSYEAAAESPPAVSDAQQPVSGEAQSDLGADSGEAAPPVPTEVVVFKPRAGSETTTRTASFASTPTSFGGTTAPPAQEQALPVAASGLAAEEAASDAVTRAVTPVPEQGNAGTASPLVWQYRPSPSPAIDPTAEVTIREKIEAQIAAEAFRERRRRATYSRSGRSA